MTDVRVSEIYTSVQGEGPRTGAGTVFLRFGGCNLRCPGWPCDTLFAVLPEHRSEWLRKTPEQVLDEVLQECKDKNVANVCLTGGEPFLQNHQSLEFIVNGLLQEGIGVEAFTNGQVAYPAWAFAYVNFIMDWKLPGSGNPATELTFENATKLKHTDAIKFVILDEADFEHAVRVWEREQDEINAQWWAGVVWEGKFSEATLVQMIQERQLPWCVNVQVHKYLWNAEMRGV